ncbi:hypothetical protein ABVK25_003162 [Lepraria finkii]|uniref:Uncharacterized protein n=1 Tax=Lepraria finkii TaxID=1340010 RepID=A0ABR4BFZ9_9LECA
MTPKLDILEAIDTGREGGGNTDSASSDAECFSHYDDRKKFGGTIYSRQQGIEKSFVLL